MTLWNRRKSICSTTFSKMKHINTLIFFIFEIHQSTLLRNLFWTRNFQISYWKVLSLVNTNEFENLSDRVSLNAKSSKKLKFDYCDSIEKFRKRRDLTRLIKFLIWLSSSITRLCFFLYFFSHKFHWNRLFW